MLFGGNLKIGVSGGPGVGKSSLAGALGAALGIPVIGEGVREWLREHGLITPHAATTSEQIALQDRYFKYKVDTESHLDNFVSDRTVIDGIVIAQHRLQHESEYASLEAIILRAKAHAKATYDLVVVPPFRHYGDEDPIRLKNVVNRKREHDAIVSYLESEEIPRLCLICSNLSDWVNQCILTLRSLGFAYHERV